MNLKQTILALAMVHAVSNPAAAADINIGKKGPTENQVEIRTTHSEGKTLEDSVNLLLKYWDGKEQGKWAVVSLPYSITKDNIRNISVGGGPRYSLDNIHILPYAMFKITPKTIEPNMGSFVTCDFPNERYQINIAGNYNFTTRQTSLGIFNAWQIGEQIVGFGSDYNSQKGFNLKLGARHHFGHSNFQITIMKPLQSRGYTVESSLKINF